MAEFGLATWLRGSETVRGFSCSLGLCALSSGEKRKTVSTLLYITGSNISEDISVDLATNSGRHSTVSWAVQMCKHVSSVTPPQAPKKQLQCHLGMDSTSLRNCTNEMNAILPSNDSTPKRAKSSTDVLTELRSFANESHQI